MIKKIYFVLMLALCSCGAQTSKSNVDYEEQIDWWKEARFGMFVHWGISSLIGTEISWSRSSYGEEKYDSLALRFNPASFDADKWIDIAESAGMKYIVLTTKHHDGFCLWDSKANSFNIMNTPYHKDICKQISDAAHKRGMKLGWYFSCREWSDSDCCTEGRTENYVEKMKGELTELLSNYGKIDILWFDYDGWPCPAAPGEIVTLIRELQPDIVFNNRLYPLTPDESHAYVGDFGMFCTPEQFVGGYGNIPWETCTTMGESRQWSIRYGDTPRPVDDLIWDTIGAAGGNGNMLMNVGPDSLGVIGHSYAACLEKIGSWINSHEGILYGTTCGPWKPTGFYVSTMKDGNVWLVLKVASDIILPFSGQYNVSSITSPSGKDISFTSENDRLFLDLPEELEGMRNLALNINFNGDIPVEATFSPFGTSGSLAYNCPCKATSSISDVYLHSPASAFDDSDNTAWVIGRRSDAYPESLYGRVENFCNPPIMDDAFEKDAKLEVDLTENRSVTSFAIFTRRNWASASLEYLSGGEWVEAARISPLDSDWEGSFPAISAQNWRLSLYGGHGMSGIEEFRLFE